MQLHIPAVLSDSQVAQFRRVLDKAEWIDERVNADHLSTQVNENRQLPESHPIAIRLGNAILDLLERHAEFMSYALPSRIVPPLFSSHSGDGRYVRHIDRAVRPLTARAQRVRTDIAATLFLSEPDEYDSGDLIIEDVTGGVSKFKLPAGSLLVYPGTSAHYVEPVTRGKRLAAFFWVQSMVHGEERRRMLFNLDKIIKKLRDQHPDEPSLADLARHYENLVRMWAEP